MTKQIISNFAPYPMLHEEEAEPVCGTDFCDKCGDCLHCYGGDECFRGKTDQHSWVKYETPTTR